MRVWTTPRKKLLKGALEVANAVGVTYGPKGRTVMLDRVAGLLSTKDGVAVAWEVSPEDPLEKMGAQLVQQACHKVNQETGDGTTTTAVLCGAILREGHKQVVAGHDPMALSREMASFAQTLLPSLLDIWQEPIEDTGLMFEVALTASNGDRDMATAIVKTMTSVGAEGMVLVEEGKSREIEIVHKQGMEIDRGWESSDFCPTGEIQAHYEVPLVAVVDQILDTPRQVADILEVASQFPHPLVLISKGLYGDALKTVLMNREQVPSIAVRCPGHVEFMRDHLEDLAALSGAVVYDPVMGEFKSEYLGSCQTVTVKKNSAVFVAFPDKFEGIETRVQHLKSRLSRTTSSHDQDKLKERIAKLTEGFCLLRVGGASETEIRERKGRMEDALHAVRVAVEGGVVPGAGMAYYKVAQLLREADTAGERLLSRALEEPLKRILQNAGSEPGVVLRELEVEPVESWVGWDVKTNEKCLLRNRIVDPYTVVLKVIQTAVSCAGTLLTVEVGMTR